MSLNLEHRGLSSLLPQLSPYLRRQLGSAGDHALALHADEVTLEHLIWVLMGDDESAIYATVDQAFADPETIAADLLSLCSGILVSTKSGALAFSTRGVRAARAARDLASERGLAEVDVACLVIGALEQLETELAVALNDAGLNPGALRDELASGRQGLSTEGHLFKHYSTAARQTIIGAAKQAKQAGEDSISPARILAAALAGDAALAELSGLTAHRVKACIQGRAEDRTPPPERSLDPDPALIGLLERLPAASSSLQLVGLVLESPESELSQTFARQKITPDLLIRARSAYDDPAK